MSHTASHSYSLRLTPHRATVLEILRSRRYHPTAAEVFELAKRKRPGISFATIYNALNWLTSKGLIAELKFGDEASRYDSVPDHHEHLVCTRCGALEDVALGLPDLFLSRTRNMSRNRFGFRLLDYRLEFLGLCSRCAGASRPSARSSATRAAS